MRRAGWGLIAGVLVFGCQDGALFVFDAGNARIRKIVPGADKASTQVYTIAGSGRVGTNLGGGEEADLVSPAGIALLPNEQILVTDPFNNVVRVITR